MQAFTFPQQTNFYQGKVRDVYYFPNQIITMIASNRISAFDVVLPKPIPYKGQVLNQIAAHMLSATANICPNWLLETPNAYTSIGKLCQPFKIEMVVRGNLTGHAWRTYQTGTRTLCGVQLPNGLRENDFFETPIITPTTKADEGHDEDISAEEIIKRQLATESEWKRLCEYALALFSKGKQLAAEKGLILVDTKYEFGLYNGEITLMDEIHTPDSSRYFYADGFEENLAAGKPQKQLSKEFVRQWLIDNDFMGKEGQTVPVMSDEWIETISNRYVELFEKVTGTQFIPQPFNEAEIFESTNICLQQYL